MKVSVIMCAYNVSAFIEKAIDSIVAQTHQNWELIIADDASTDNTVALVQPYLKDSRIRLFLQPVNQGYLKNKNFAFTLATAELLTQLDADDLSEPDRLEKQVAVFEKHPDINICGTNYRRIDETGNKLPSQTYNSDFIIKWPETDYPFWFPGLMFRRGLFERYGAFSSYFENIYGEDFYWTLLVHKNNPIYFLKDVLYNYRINSGSLTNVLDNNRKLIVQDILVELRRQQISEGTDWIEQDNLSAMHAFEATLLSDKKLMAKRYRIWAAKALDNKQMGQARTLLGKSLKLNAVSVDTFKTCLYYLKRSLSN